MILMQIVQKQLFEKYLECHCKLISNRHFSNLNLETRALVRAVSSRCIHSTFTKHPRVNARLGMYNCVGSPSKLTGWKRQTYAVNSRFSVHLNLRSNLLAVVTSLLSRRWHQSSKDSHFSGYIISVWRGLKCVSFIR